MSQFLLSAIRTSFPVLALVVGAIGYVLTPALPTNHMRLVYADTSETHTECLPPEDPLQEGTSDLLECRSVAGAGPYDCQSSADCNHYDCVERLLQDGPDECQLVPGKGANKCSDDDECNHTVCEDLLQVGTASCLLQTGRGEDECQGDAECNHRDCSYSPPGLNFFPPECKLTAGKGDDVCQSVTECPSHRVCVYSLNPADPPECGWGEGAGTDECTVGSECSQQGGASAALAYSRSASEQEQKLSVSPVTETVRVAAPPERTGNVVGSKEAPVELQVFQDLNCGVCRWWFKEVLPQLVKAYVLTNDLRIVFREFPLGNLGPARQLAIQAKCAAEQNKYLEYISAVYRRRGVAAPEINELTLQVSLDQSKLNRCAAELGAKLVDVDVAEGTKAGATGTPTFILNGRVFRGGHRFEKFAAEIEAILLSAEAR